MNKTGTATEPGREQVTLLAPHNHAGLLRKPGETLTITHAQAAWLAARGIIAKPTEAPNPGE